MQKAAPLRRCFFCGEQLGHYWDWESYDTCGKSECDREARDAIAAERIQAHEQLDDDRGWR